MGFHSLLRRAIIALLLAAFAIITSACGGQGRTLSSAQSASDAQPRVIALDNALAELDALPVPNGVKPEVFQQLKDVLAEALRSRGTSKITCTPPTGDDNRVNDLAIADNGNGTYSLTWHYRNLGDYNQDGIVGIADITPLAMHYGEVWATGEENSLAAVADGSGNNKVDIADVTPIAMNFGVQVDHYSVAGSPTESGSYAEFGSVNIEDGLDKATKRMGFNYDLAPVAGSWYCVVPHDGASTPGDESNTVQASTAGLPVAPSDLTATALSSTEISLVWTDNSTGELGFRIERKIGVSGPWDEILTTSPSVHVYTDTGLTPATTYVYRVRAYNTIGNSPYSNFDDATTDPSPDAPIAPTGISGKALSASEIGLSWTDNSLNEDGFKIVRKQGVLGAWGDIATLGTDDNSFIDTDLVTNTEYFYRVLAFNAFGNSAWSNEAKINIFEDRTTWVHTYGGSNDDSASSISVDSYGNTYTAGSTKSYSAGYNDLLVQKYSPDGVPIWKKTWGEIGDDYGSEICTDNEGDIFVLGTTGSYSSTFHETEAFLLKYAPDGTLLWRRTWGSESHGDTVAGGLAVDSQGSAYITGGAFSDDPSLFEVILLKYSSTGTIEWNKEWGGSSEDLGSDITIDSAGNIDIAGRTSSFGPSSDILLLQYSPDGVLLWQKTWDGSGFDNAFALDTDVSNNIFIAGYTENGGPGSRDACVLKFSSAGMPQWQVTWGGTGADSASGIHVDRSGNAWVTGYSDSFDAGSVDLLLLKYSSNGTLLLQKSWGGDNPESASDIFLDVTGMVYIAGLATNIDSLWSNAAGTEASLPYSGIIPIGTESTLAYTERIPIGIEAVLSQGIEDAGGGGYDTLVMKIDPLLI